MADDGRDKALAVSALARFLGAGAASYALASAAPKNQPTTRDWFRFVTNKATPKVAEVYIYGDIGETFFGEGVSAQAFVDELNAIDAEELAVRINSPGGSAWDGLTIANAIMRHKARTTTYIDGLAASAASIVAVAGDEVVTSKYGQAMLHNAHAVVMGTAKDMREVAAQLDNLNSSMATYYADRAGGDPAEWSRAMAKETWYNADEMVAAGLATRIDTSAVREEVEAAVASAMASTAEKYRYQGRTAAPAPTNARSTNTSEEPVMADKKTLLESLGLPDDATEADIIAATRKAIGAPDTPEAPPTGTPVIVVEPAAPPADAAPAAPPAVAPAAKAETVTLDTEAYAALRQQAAMGAEAHKTLQAQAHAKVVDAAIDAGKITPARRDHYMSLMRSDPQDTTDLLTNRLQPGASVPLTEVGHSADATPSASVKEDPRFTNWKVD